MAEKTTNSVRTVVVLPYFYYLRVDLFFEIFGISIASLIGIGSNVTISNRGVGVIILRTTSSVRNIVDLLYYFRLPSSLFFELLGIGIPCLMGICSSVTIWDLGVEVM